MQEDAELPNPELKAKNIHEAFQILIKSGKFRVPPNKKDEVEIYLKQIKILAQYEDATPCKGRKCLACEGCDSFRLNITEVREIIDREEEEEEVEPLKAAAHAVEQHMREVGAMMEAIAQKTTIQFSSWEMIKFMREAILSTLNVDLFVIKKEIKKGPAYMTKLKKDDWTIIRTVMIINRLDWWLEDIASVMDVKTEPDIFKLFLVDKKNHTYLPLQMAFPSEDGSKYLTISEYVNGLPTHIRNKIMTIQNHFGSSIESTVKWTVNFHG